MKRNIHYLIKATILTFSLAGCVVNPRYSDPQIMYNEQLQKYPQNSHQIEQNKEAYKEWHAKEVSKPVQSEDYVVKQEKTSGWSVGDPDSVIHLGQNKYKYHHKIKLKLVCNKSAFLPTPVSLANVSWKITDSIFGNAQTTRNGDLFIHFSTDQVTKFSEILIEEGNHRAVLSLYGDLTFDSKSETCTK